MAIQARRGLKKDFDPNKLLSGEPAVPLDTREVYMAFAPGDVQKLATHENVKEMVEEATDEVIADFTEGVNNATEYATEQGDYAKMQGNHAKTQGDYAKVQGDYAKAQGQAAESIVLGNIATETTPGIVRGGGDVKVDPTTGDMTAPDKLEKTGDAKDNTVTFVQAEEDGELTSGSKLSILIGLIKKKFADILTGLAGKIDKTSVAQTTEVNDPNRVPSTVVTNGMQQNIVKNANDINVINNKLGNLTQFYRRDYVLRGGALLDFILNNVVIGGIVSIAPIDGDIPDAPIPNAWAVAIVYRHASSVWTVKWFQDGIPDKEYVNQIYVDRWVNATWKHIDYIV